MDNFYVATLNDGSKVSYGVSTPREHLTLEEWIAICHVMMKEENESTYEIFVEDKNEDAILAWGKYIAMRNKYKALLEMLPQDIHTTEDALPRWVAQEVQLNSIKKEEVVDFLVKSMSDAVDEEDTTLYQSVDEFCDLLSYS